MKINLLTEKKEGYKEGQIIITKGLFDGEYNFYVFGRDDESGEKGIFDLDENLWIELDDWSNVEEAFSDFDEKIVRVIEKENIVISELGV